MNLQDWLQQQRALYPVLPDQPPTLSTHPVSGEWQSSNYLQNQFWWGGGASQEACNQLQGIADLSHVAVISFGPVQTFLGAGQRLRDWAVASWLCHYLTAVLIHHWEQNGGRVLLPLHQSSTLVNWLGEQDCTDETFWQAELPNVVTGIYPDRPNWIEDCKKVIQHEWSRFLQALESVVVQLEPKLLNGIGWRVIHLDNQYLWSVYSETKPIAPGQIQQDIARLHLQIESRKVGRDWQGTWWAGRTSPTAGSLSIWHPGLQPITKGGTWGLKQTQLNEWWDRAVQESRFSGLFSGNDRLNSIEMVKRLASVPEIIEPTLEKLWNQTPPDCPWNRFPDRTAIAAAWVPDAVPAARWNQDLEFLYEYFDRKPKAWGVPSIDRINQNQQSAYVHPQILERRNITDWVDAEQLAEWEDTVPQRWDSPIEWTVGWRGDGDHMGQWFSGQQYQTLQLPWSKWHLTSQLIQQQQLDVTAPTVPDHPRQIELPHMLDLSVLFDLWNRLLYPLVEEHHKGRVIFAGGDDFLLLAPLTEAIDLTTHLHQLWSGHRSPLTEPLSPAAEGWVQYQQEVYPVPGKQMKFSLGVVIAQRRVPQSLWHKGLTQAYKAAKEQGRDRVCVKVLFNSGQTLEWVCPWTLWNLLMPIDPQTSEKTSLNRWEKLLAYLEGTRLQHVSLFTVRDLLETLWASVGIDLTWKQVETIGRREFQAEIGDWQWWIQWISLKAFLTRQERERQQWIERVLGGQR